MSEHSPNFDSNPELTDSICCPVCDSSVLSILTADPVEKDNFDEWYASVHCRDCNNIDAIKTKAEPLYQLSEAQTAEYHGSIADQISDMSPLVFTQALYKEILSRE